MGQDDLLVSTKGDILRVTINRPHAANAINDVVAAGLVEALAAADSNPAIRGILITGTGERAFSAGRDMKNPHNLSELDLARQRRSESRAYVKALVSCRKPLVVAMNGAAIGAGWMIALFADLIVAADHAQMVLPEIDLRIPVFLGHALIAQQCGEAVATELVLTGRRLTAAEALQRGLVSAVVPYDRLEAEAEARVTMLASKPAETMTQLKDWLGSRRREVVERAELAYDAAHPWLASDMR